MPETTPLIKAALNLRVGAGFDVYVINTSEFSFPLLDIESKSNKKGQLQISRLITALTLCYIIDNISKYTNIHLLYPICF